MEDTKLLQDVKRLMIVRYPRFATQIANANLEYNKDLPYHTAATDGKNIYFDPDYLASLGDEDKLFIIAHELMHVKFEHMYRMKQKNGEMRDPEIWNIATDAIINANLEKDNFKIKEGYVNMPEALNYTSEELYDKLLKEKQEKEQEENKKENSQGQSKQQDGNQQGESQQGNSSNKNNNKKEKDQNSQDGQSSNTGKEDKNKHSSEQGQEQNDSQGKEKQGEGQEQSDKSKEKSSAGGQPQQSESSRNFADDHTLWERAFEEHLDQDKQKNKKCKEKKSNEKSNDIEKSVKEKPEEKTKYDERVEFEHNREERSEKARQVIEKMREREMQKIMGSGNNNSIGADKPVLDWRNVLKRKFDESETIWSNRRSVAENNYAMRLEDYEIEDQAVTEVMIDVSGSVSDELVRAFLRQLKPLVKESILKIGFFAGVAVNQFQEIKTEKDVDKIKILKPAMDGTDMDAAVRAFSKNNDINKLVFTDGYAGVKPQDDLKNENVTWLVYKNRDYHPCCGEVVQIYPEFFNELENLIEDETQSISF